MYMTSASLVELAFGAIGDKANGVDSRTVFVENGAPKNIREIGLGWEFETGYIEIYGKNPCYTRAAGSVATIFISELNFPSAAKTINRILWLALIILASAVSSV